jgi:hypothetical protein
MSQKFIEVGSLQTLELILAGGVLGGKNLSPAAGKVLGLHGLTLIIGIQTVTFSDADGSGYPLVGTTKSIKKEIEDATTGVTATFSEGRLVLSKAGGVTVDKDGTANAAFGFSKAVDLVGTVYDVPGGTAPRVIAVSAGARMDSYFAHVELP